MCQHPPLSRTYQLREISREQDRAPLLVSLYLCAKAKQSNLRMKLCFCWEASRCATAHVACRSRRAGGAQQCPEQERAPGVGGWSFGEAGHARVNKEQDCKRQDRQRRPGR
jgi:hypothetical protein